MGPSSGFLDSGLVRFRRRGLASPAKEERLTKRGSYDYEVVTFRLPEEMRRKKLMAKLSSDRAELAREP